uniref:Aaap-like protein 3 n=1 Tax=Anaplasma marginale TaxID=770 RepID=A0A871E379_ANAMA|nr:aaap-like protein 3 [Anaplasma marginale]
MEIPVMEWEPVIIHEAQKKKREREELAAQVRRELRAELNAIDTAWRFVIVCQTGQSMTKHTSSEQLDVELHATNSGNGMELTLKLQVQEGVELQSLEQVFRECADRCVAAINSLGTGRSRKCADPGLIDGQVATPSTALGQPAPSTALTSVAAEVATPSTALGV